MNVESGDGFDHWLDQQFQNLAVKQNGPSPIPAQAQYHGAYLQGGPHMSVLAKAATVVSTKAAIGLTVAALAVGAAGAASEAAITGSANPGNWGQQVVQQVQKCKDALAPGTHGIGGCVSAFAKKHGQQVSSDDRASAARENSGQSTSHPTGAPSTHSTGQAGTPATGQSTSHPTGKPSSTPPQS